MNGRLEQNYKWKKLGETFISHRQERRKKVKLQIAGRILKNRVSCFDDYAINWNKIWVTTLLRWPFLKVSTENCQKTPQLRKLQRRRGEKGFSSRKKYLRLEDCVFVIVRYNW